MNLSSQKSICVRSQFRLLLHDDSQQKTKIFFRNISYIFHQTILKRKIQSIVST